VAMTLRCPLLEGTGHWADIWRTLVPATTAGIGRVARRTT
jgi:hypothetical protein